MLSMNHFVMDAYHGYRSRLDDILLIQEILEEIPLKLGIKTVMPPFVLPYYNGVVPEDCGITAFVFTTGGHFTIHTFSFRETYFVDLLTPEAIDAAKLASLLKEALPAEKINTFCLEREKKESYPQKIEINETLDFGPHLFLDFKNYRGPKTMDQLFAVFDTMPFKIGMTPIIRPYAIKNIINGEPVTSIITMLAESHISLHYFKKSQRAYMDLFSCRFFKTEEVIPKLKEMFQSEVCNETLMSRGSKYQKYKTDSVSQSLYSGAWVNNVYCQR
jgi:S-adenosylmethionine/arginine decarboxylase-like enzyme